MSLADIIRCGRIPHPPLRGMPYWSRPTVPPWLLAILAGRTTWTSVWSAAAWPWQLPGQLLIRANQFPSSSQVPFTLMRTKLLHLTVPLSPLWFDLPQPCLAHAGILSGASVPASQTLFLIQDDCVERERTGLMLNLSQASKHGYKGAATAGPIASRLLASMANCCVLLIFGIHGPQNGHVACQGPETHDSLLCCSGSLSLSKCFCPEQHNCNRSSSSTSADKPRGWTQPTLRCCEAHVLLVVRQLLMSPKRVTSQR